MQSNDSEPILLIPGNIGSVGDFDPTAPSPKIASKGNLYTGGLYLTAALNEMHQILRLCEDLQENHRELLRETRAQYDNLYLQKKELELLQKRRSILRPLRFVEVSRAKRTFLENAQELWNSTRTTSDRLRRAILSVPSVDVAPVESESLGRDERIGGLVTQLPSPEEMSTPATQEALAAAQRVASILASCENPFASPASDNQNARGPPMDPGASSSARSSASTSPGSPISASTIHLNFSYNIINNTDSNTSGLTINNASEGSGSKITHNASVNSPSS